MSEFPASHAAGLFTRSEPPTRRKAAKASAKTALTAILSVSLVQPGWAGSGAPNTQPPPQAAYVTNTPALSAVSGNGDGTCVQQYNSAIATAVDNQLIAQGVSVTADGVSTAAKIAVFTANSIATTAKAAASTAKAVGDGVVAGGLTAAAAGSFEPIGGASPGLVTAAGGTADVAVADSTIATAETAQAVVYAAQLVNIGADTTKVAANVTALSYANQAQNIRNDISTNHLPNCNQTFNGTITSTVPAGQPVSSFKAATRISAAIPVSAEISASVATSPPASSRRPKASRLMAARSRSEIPIW